MDFDAKVAELEEIIRRYRNCVASGEFNIAIEYLDEWRQATRLALAAAFTDGYEAATKDIADKGFLYNG